MLRLFLAEPGGQEETCLPPLSEYRKRKLAAVKNARLRAQMLTAERLLIAALREQGVEAPLDIAVSAQGKPYLRNSAVQFTISHSGDFVACAVADYAIGLDIQTAEAYNERLVRRFFSASEQAFLLKSKKRDADFTALWCCKESYLKALGTGLAKELASFSVTLSAPPALAEDESVHFWMQTMPRYIIALCAIGGNTAEPETITWL